MYGYVGVEIFFIISGYVIAKTYISKNPKQFAVSRLVRLYPTFWVALSLTTILTIIWGDVNGLRVYFSQFLANLTIVPFLVGSQPVDGVYWTLEYEILFYLLVFLLMFCGMKRYISLVFVLWTLLLAASIWTSSPVPTLYGRGYFIFFMCGFFLAEFQRSRNKRNLIPLSLAIMSSVKFSYMNVPNHVLERGGIQEIPALLVSLSILLIVFLNFSSFASVKLPLGEIAGALTYPIYLVHAHIGYILISKFASSENWVWVYFTTAGFVLMISYILYEVVEVKAGLHMKKIFMKLINLLFIPFESLMRKKETNVH